MWPHSNSAWILTKVSFVVVLIENSFIIEAIICTLGAVPGLLCHWFVSTRCQCGIATDFRGGPKHFTQQYIQCGCWLLVRLCILSQIINSNANLPLRAFTTTTSEHWLRFTCTAYSSYAQNSLFSSNRSCLLVPVYCTCSWENQIIDGTVSPFPTLGGNISLFSV